MRELITLSILGAIILTEAIVISFTITNKRNSLSRQIIVWSNMNWILKGNKSAKSLVKHCMIKTPAVGNTVTKIGFVKHTDSTHVF